MKLLTVFLCCILMAGPVFSGEPLKDFSMIIVEGGSFIMGGDGDFDGKPKHKVALSPFKISDVEISQKLFEEIMGFNPSSQKGLALPVEGLDWYDAILFCNQLSIKEGLKPYYVVDKSKKDKSNLNPDDVKKWVVSLRESANGYRLPTEAQWEFAARGGSKSRSFVFSGGNILGEVGWYYKNADHKTHAGRLKAPNELGLYDMTGNVWEFCFDWHGPYDASDQTDPIGPESGKDRVFRGGAWQAGEDNGRVTFRVNDYQGMRYKTVGLRIVLPR